MQFLLFSYKRPHYRYFPDTRQILTDLADTNLRFLGCLHVLREKIEANKDDTYTLLDHSQNYF